MLLVCPNRSQPLSLDHINSHTSSNGQIAKIFTVNSAPQITPWVFRIRRHGRLVYRFGSSGMGNNAFTAQPVISSDSRASRRLTASARDCRLRSFEDYRHQSEGKTRLSRRQRRMLEREELDIQGSPYAG